MNRRRYDNNRARFDKSSDRRDGNYSYSRVNPKDDYKGRYGNSSKYFDDSKYSRSFKSHYKNSSRSDGDRLKRSRNDDSRHNSSFLSPRRNDLRPKTPPPPSIRSSGNNYHNYHNHRGSRNDSSYRNSFSPTSASRKRQSQRNVASYRNSTRLRPNSIRDSDSRRPKGIIRRKVIVSSSRKIHSMRNERTRMIRLARIKRNKDSLKIKNNASSKKSKEDHSDDDHSENKRNSSNNECENEDKKSSSKKNGQDLNCKDKEVKEGDEKSSEDKSKEGNNEEDSSESRRNRSSKRESISPERNNKPFIKLICVHCRIKCRTFSEYQSHLYSRTHRIAMRRVGVRQKAQLSRMRLEQRNVQRDLEENAKEDLGDQQYCLLCPLDNFDIELRKTDEGVLITAEYELKGDIYSKLLNNESVKSISTDQFFDLDTLYQLLTDYLEKKPEKTFLSISENGKLYYSCQILIGSVVKKLEFNLQLEKKELDTVTRLENQFNRLSAKMLKFENERNVPLDAFQNFERMIFERFEKLEESLARNETRMTQFEERILEIQQRDEIDWRFNLTPGLQTKFKVKNGFKTASSLTNSLSSILTKQSLPKDKISKFTFLAGKTDYMMVGITTEKQLNKDHAYQDPAAFSYVHNGYCYVGSTAQAGFLPYKEGDRVSFICDMKTGKIQVFLNDISIGSHEISKQNLESNVFYPYLYTSTNSGVGATFI